MSSAPQPRTIGIVGLGLIGGSIGLALRDPTRELIGCDVSKKAEEKALARFCVDRIVALDEVAQAEVVFVAVPPSSVIYISEAILERKPEGTVITDCASVKTEVATWAERRRLPDFLPGHPMAGHEKGGAEFSSAWMFRNARWILTPTEHTSERAISAVTDLVLRMGATPIPLEPALHDKHVAILSHLPHVLAALLVLTAGELEHLEIGAGSWKDLTRVGGVDPELWSQIFSGNRECLGEVLEEFESSLNSFRGLLEDNDVADLKTILERAQAAKSKQALRLAESDPKPAPRRSSRRKP